MVISNYLWFSNLVSYMYWEPHNNKICEITPTLIDFDCVIVWYWFSEDFLTQSNPFFTSNISSKKITRAHYDDIIIKNDRFYQKITYVGWCKYHDEFIFVMLLYYYFIFQIIFCDWFPQISVHPSSECTLAETLNSDRIIFFDKTCHKKQSQTNPHPYIEGHICHAKLLPTPILLIRTFAPLFSSLS